MGRRRAWWIVGGVALTVGSAAPAAAGKKAVGLKGNPGQFFSAEEYPIEAIRLHQQGRVVVKLWIDTNGKVASCTLAQSSGSPSLDQKTCEIALARVTYTSARNRTGQPIAASATLPVRWVLPEGPIDVAKDPMPTNMAMEMTFSVDSAGIVQACASTVTPKTIARFEQCDQNPVGSKSEFLWTRDGRPIGGTVTRRLSQEIKIDP